MNVRLIANGSQAWERWIRRWGLSFLVNDDVLFDAFGHNWFFRHNLQAFKVKISSIKHIVISHEHWDHVEGLKFLLASSPEAVVYFPSRTSHQLIDQVRTMGGRLRLVSGPLKIRDGVYLSGEVVGHYGNEPMPEQALVLESSRGLILLVGCAHPGIVEMVEHVKLAFSRSVYGVIGGLHLKGISDDKVLSTVSALKNSSVEMIVPLHCTGPKAARLLRSVFRENCYHWREGASVSLT